MSSCSSCSLLILIVFTTMGCRPTIFRSSWHEKVGWKAEDFFDDPLVIQLCQAIESNDVAEIDRLVAAGADVNALGKDNMTPLMWAYPENKIDRFKRLLEHGADPNVYFESDLSSRGAFLKGETVTHLAAGTRFEGYFDAVFDHKGDPNLRDQSALGQGDTPIFTAIQSSPIDLIDRIRKLIERGADINCKSNGSTPVMEAVSWGQFVVALELLKMGADPTIYPSDTSNKRLVHSVVMKRNGLKTYWPDFLEAQYNELVQWLEEHGESIAEAEQDIERWKSWQKELVTIEQFKRKMEDEIAARKSSAPENKP
ncbi:MAG: ankyrin repeat domain-containing protein [Pirellulaceae bacterium]|nr:ankyrin repeat domain-containing protein [Pirellulaceae bacterium]